MKINIVLISGLCLGVFINGACAGRGGGNREDGNGRTGGRASSNQPSEANSAVNANANNAVGPDANGAKPNTNEIVERPEDISRGLLQMEDAWNQAYTQKDEAWFQQNLADDYTEVSDTGKTINDKAGAIAEMKADKSTEIITELLETKARVEGNSAVVTGVNHVKLKDPNGKQVDYKHRFTDTFVERNGKWLIWADQATRIP